MNVYQVDRKRWATLTIFEQMGNIYSEVGRAIKANEQQNTLQCQQAVVRAIDLFDATVALLIAKHSPKAKEVLRAKEQFLEAIYVDSMNQENIASLDRYFYQFALAARIHK